jgi:hypothetical protein
VYRSTGRRVFRFQVQETIFQIAQACHEPLTVFDTRNRDLGSDRFAEPYSDSEYDSAAH